MKRDMSVSLWEVKIPIKGLISIQHDGAVVDKVEFHLAEDDLVAKTVVEGSFGNVIAKAIKRVNRALDKIALEGGASIRIETSGIRASQVSNPIGGTSRRLGGSMAQITIKVMHPIDEGTLSKAAKLRSNIRDEDKKRIFEKSLSHYRNGLNAESDGNPRGAFLDFWDSIEVIATKYGQKGGDTKDKICDCFEKYLGERKEKEIKELCKIRQDAAHGLKDTSDPEEVKIMIEKPPQMKDLARQFLISFG
ncbi:MAG: hypothetical protein PHD13_02485 [Methanocellales archaeon]|nr:hypothetical protein [Methanocellales archaeon]MDD3291677.1 hypothetical protein [Methanocellales archaeon]MDD5235027.1 hypothetical protein [Methanocellales archaeon]MDD5485165.1 hypothetical protein [Methanocellales archaeon]